MPKHTDHYTSEVNKISEQNRRHWTPMDYAACSFSDVDRDNANSSLPEDKAYVSSLYPRSFGGDPPTLGRGKTVCNVLVDIPPPSSNDYDSKKDSAGSAASSKSSSGNAAAFWKPSTETTSTSAAPANDSTESPSSCVVM